MCTHFNSKTSRTYHLSKEVAHQIKSLKPHGTIPDYACLSLLPRGHSCLVTIMLTLVTMIFNGRWW